MSLRLLKRADGVFTSEGGTSINASKIASLDRGWTPASIYKSGTVVCDKSVRSAEVIERQFCQDLYDSIESEITTSLFGPIKYALSVQFDRMEGSQIVRYKPGDAFKPHIDSGRTYPERVVSVIKYLSSDYSGGQTFFPDLNFEVGAISPEFLVFFPELLHESRPIQEGEKLVFVTWLIKPQIKWL